MRTAGNCTHFMARQCEFPRHVAADRPGAEYADLHARSSLLSSNDRHIESPGLGEYPEIWRDIFPFFDNPAMDKFAATRVFVKICGCWEPVGRRPSVGSF